MKKNKFYLVIIVFLLSVFSLSGFSFGFGEGEFIKTYSPQKGIYVVDINTEKHPDCFAVYYSDELETVGEISEKLKPLAAINAGFFDPMSKETVSYVVQDGKLTGNPELNTKLTETMSQKPFFKDILNRSEFRVMSCENNEIRYDIAKHNDELPAGCSIKHSVQAGPQLLPELRTEEEAFVVKDGDKIIRESASVLKKRARSAIGIKNGYVYLVAVSNENEMTLKELADFMKTLNPDKAMAFDGGGSTSLYTNVFGTKNFTVNCNEDNFARKVKSVLYVK